MRLRHLLASIALGAPLVSSCDDIIITENREEKQFRVPVDPEPTLAALLETCKMGGDCAPLCEKVDRTFADRIEDCHVVTDALGDLVLYTGVYIHEDTCAGRRPNGFVPCGATGRPLGAYLAGQAMLEAASVQAFEDLRADLAALGAPRHLLAEARRAAHDEVRHARACERLARRRGGHWVHPRAVPAARRSPSEIAFDNIVEGCVRETYGAAVARYQARAAGDHEIRRAMSAIARDEANHAALAWRVQRWLEPRLTASERRHAHELARTARAELHAQVSEPPAEIRDPAGVPSAATSRHLLAALTDQLWS